MSDAPAETATTDAPANEPAPETPATDLTAELDKWKAQARKNEERAKANATAVKELEQLKATMMTDQERAVAEAKALGRSEALAEAAVDLVDAAIAAKAAGRLAEEQLATIVAPLNRTAFLDPDGKVDHAAVAEFVDGIAPATPEPTVPAGFPPLPDLGQGTRGTPPALNSDALTDALARAVRAK